MENKEKIKIAIVGILTGLLCGLFASGGGLILVPAFVYIFKQSEKKARAMGIICGIGGIIGGAIGANLMKKINDKYLVLIFIAFLIYAGVSILRM